MKDENLNEYAAKREDISSTTAITACSSLIEYQCQLCVPVTMLFKDTYLR